MPLIENARHHAVVSRSGVRVPAGTQREVSDAVFAELSRYDGVGKPGVKPPKAKKRPEKAKGSQRRAGSGGAISTSTPGLTKGQKKAEEPQWPSGGPQEGQGEPQGPSTEEQAIINDLPEMDEDTLKALAEARDIDLGQASTPDGYRKKIRDALTKQED